MESKIPSRIVDQIDDFSQHQLNKKADLKTLYIQTIDSGKDKIFDDLSFTAKYVQGLLRVLKTGAANPEVKNLDHIKKDFTHNMQKVVEQMKEIVAGADEQIKIYFDKTYFDMSRESMHNLTQILSDLEWAKKYFNMQKRLPSD
jgi:tRNA uridine 5-carbamoylmethylation protein Kti12